MIDYTTEVDVSDYAADVVLNNNVNDGIKNNGGSATVGPDGNDKKAVLEYLESIRDDLPLPSGEYVCDSFEIDPESIVLEND